MYYIANKRSQRIDLFTTRESKRTLLAPRIPQYMRKFCLKQEASMALTSSTILKLSLIPALIFDEHFKYIAGNAPFNEITGYTDTDHKNFDLRHVFHGHIIARLLPKLKPDDIYFTHFELTTRDGDQINACANLTRVEDNHILMIIQPDPTASQPDNDDTSSAFHDPLTSLPNRLLLQKRIDEAIKESASGKTFAAIIFVDLDEFKPVNDLHGHKCGDYVLVTVSERMLKIVRQHDTVARIGGDEFVLVCTQMNAPVHAGLTAKRLIRAITQPIPWKDIHVHVSASIGISIIPNDGNIPDTLLQKADEAMYLAKKSGKNGYSFYDEEAYFI